MKIFDNNKEIAGFGTVGDKQVIWFTTGTGLVGIVLTTTTDGERVAYIGPADGAIEESDVETIVSWGGRIPLYCAEKIVSHLRGGGHPSWR